MGQRVGLARTLLHDPAVLILDEPANGLDPQARVEMRELILRLAALGKTVLVTSHILPELSRICSQVAILTHGKLRAYGTVAEIGRQVTQVRSIEIQLASAEKVAAAAAVIRRSLAAEDKAEIVESPAEASVRFRTQRLEAELADLLGELVKEGIPVTQFRELQTDLEEAFLQFARPEAGAPPEQPALAGTGAA